MSKEQENVDTFRRRVESVIIENLRKDGFIKPRDPNNPGEPFSTWITVDDDRWHYESGRSPV